MGTGRSFQRSLLRHIRQIIFSTTIAIFIVYVLAPSSFDSNSVFTHLSPPPGQQRNHVQFPFRQKGVVAGDKAKADAVRETMRDTFQKYREAAWGMDEVRPITGGNRTSRNGWAATLVDTMTTTAIMGLEEEFLLQLNYAADILDFSHAVQLVDPFETTIRYLGALVSTVDLIDANFTTFKTPIPKALRDAVLAKAVSLADKLAPGFDTPTGMIWPRINFTDSVGCKEVGGEELYPEYSNITIGPARAGTNWLENTRLSSLTGEPIYGENATKAWSPLVYSKWVEDWPGIIDGPWDIMSGMPFDRQRSWDAGHDSYYEYLIKAHIMDPYDAHSEKYRDRWVEAVDSVEKHLVFSSTVGGGATSKRFLHHWRNGRLINEMGHLACFSGGNLMLGGQYLGRKDIIQLGADLVDTCHETYISTTTRIGPENFRWVSQTSGIDAMYQPEHEVHWLQAQKHGFWIANARWKLRPETVESYFYAYRITGNKMYQDWAWDAYTAMVAASKAPYGYAEIKDVTHQPGAGNQEDKAESFWGAETLKYLYLIFADDDVVSLDEWVFSTEAHPFRIGRTQTSGV